MFLDNVSLWLDEGSSLRVSRSLFSSLRDRNGAAYYVLLHFWRTLGVSEAWLRGLSALFDCAGLLVFKKLCESFCKTELETCLALAIYIFLPSHVVQAANIRMYSLWGLVNLIILVLLFPSRPRSWSAGKQVLIMGCLLFLSLEIHRYTALFAITYAAIAVNRMKECGWKRNAVFASTALVLACSVYRLLPDRGVLLLYIHERAAPILPEIGMVDPVGAFLFDPWYDYFTPHPLWHRIAGIIGCATFFFGLFAMKKTGREQLAVCLGMFLFPLCLLTLFSLRSYPRLLHPLGVPFCISAACAISYVPRKLGIPFALCLLTTFAYMDVRSKLTTNQDFRAALTELSQARHSDTVLLVVPEYAEPAVIYYSGSSNLTVGFPKGSAGLDEKAVGDVIRAFEFVELAYLVSHRAEDYDTLRPIVAATHSLEFNKLVEGIQISRYRRKDTTTARSKLELCGNWPSACRQHPEWNVW